MMKIQGDVQTLTRIYVRVIIVHDTIHVQSVSSATTELRVWLSVHDAVRGKDRAYRQADAIRRGRESLEYN